jgi:hypothetical protein
MEVATGCTNLLSLTVEKCGLQDADASLIMLGRHCHALTDLDFECEESSWTSVTDIGLIAVANGCPLLQNLCLSECKAITDTSVIRVAEQCPLLKSVILSYCTDDLHGDATLSDASLFAFALHSLNLESLDLDFVENVTNTGMTAVVEGCLKLRMLNVGNNEYITEEAVVALRVSYPQLTIYSN